MIKLELVLACNHKGVIGIGDKIPWHVPEDFKFFKELTHNRTILMGVKTYLGIKQHYTKPGADVLPNRNIILVGDATRSTLNLPIIDSNQALTENLQQLSSLITSNEPLLVCGGASTYLKFLPVASRLHLSLINKQVTSDDLVYLDKRVLDQFEPLAAPINSIISKIDSINVDFFRLDRNSS